MLAVLLMPLVAVADDQSKASQGKREAVKQESKKVSDEESNAYYKLESTFVGDKEQPAVSYFIPWKGTSTPDKLQWNLDVKYDSTLDLVDREVVLRSMNIYDEMGLENAGDTE
ncbi:hypothetical protein P886_3478 [Alteromonadaceae bacterium 2753L.S.0a.02]|nr:hypothetical protein P886_3478 [Alteromonadaceae bacterium 2753L.S.0a.02]